LSYLKSKGIVAQAYSPLGSTNSPILFLKGLVILPKSVTPTRIASNIAGAITALQKLNEADIEKLDGVAASGKQRRFVGSKWGVDLGFENWP